MKGTRTQSTSFNGSPRHGHRILLAEDDEQMRWMLCEWLESMGCTVIDCSSGHGLLDRLTFMPTSELMELDAIITDHRMPGITGLQVLESVLFLNLPPVVLITAYSDDNLLARCRSLRTITLLEKPFEKDAFLSVVRTILEPADP